MIPENHEWEEAYYHTFTSDGAGAGFQGFLTDEEWWLVPLWLDGDGGFRYGGTGWVMQ